MASVRLEPMTPERFATWRDFSVAAYAEDNIKSGRWDEATALAQSEAAFQSYLPQGLDTPKHFLWSVISEAGDDVGMLWVGTERKPGHAFIYDIEMNPDQQGRGYGTATLLALEDWCRANGLSVIGLHVFGFNAGAWKLYKRMGYVETDVNMEKHL